MLRVDAWRVRGEPLAHQLKLEGGARVGMVGAARGYSEGGVEGIRRPRTLYGERLLDKMRVQVGVVMASRWRALSWRIASELRPY